MIRTIEVISLFFAGIIIYTYITYPILIYVLAHLKKPKKYDEWSSLPFVTHIVAAYNEAECIHEKIENSLSLEYPPDRLKLVVITDGSTDGTDLLAGEYDDVTLLHQPNRHGKTAAINRALSFTSGELIICSDANTCLTSDSLLQLIRPFTDPAVGVVAGEKKIFSKQSDEATGAGEGIYWKYESLLKKWDARFYSAVGAAGELYAFRKSYYLPLDEAIILEDFYLSLSMAMRGYRTEYVPEAIALENPSDSIVEEYKRKVRIVAGGFQSMWLLLPLLNVFTYGRLCFQYVSHRVLRWTLAPMGLPFLLAGSGWLAFHGKEAYLWLFLLQVIFYLLALGGYFLQRKHLKMKVFFIPFYFVFMNYSTLPGFLRFIRGRQTVLWEKSRRK